MNKKALSSRYLAINILCSREMNNQPVDLVMDRHLAGTALADPRDRQLVMNMVYGVLRWRGYLDWIVENHSTHPLVKMKNRTLQALRLGLLQLLFMDRVPASAAINETVQALKDMNQPRWLTGFVNGLLRRVDRERDRLPHPLQPETHDQLPETALLSHPAWLIERWQKRYGDAEARRICLANNTLAPVWLRANSALISPAALLEKLQQQGLRAESGRHSPLAIKLSDFQGPVPEIPGFQDGLFQVQDEAAQLISLLLGPLQPGKHYLDGCAGLGGKTSHLAQMLLSGSVLSAVEPNPGRLTKLKENLGRLQFDRTVTIVEGSLASLLPGGREQFAGILIDAPCSGLGVIRRHPDIRWNRKPGDLLRYQDLQLDLLETAAQLLAPGGILVYATCSTEPEENEDVIKHFLAGEPHFVLADPREVLPERGVRLVDRHGFFRTLPGQDDLDGFFSARLIKK